MGSALAIDEGSAEEDSAVGNEGGTADSAGGVDEDGEESGSGEVLVGPRFTKLVMSSGVFWGVTLSMNWKEGRRSTVVLWSEWSGMGMLEAESMSFYDPISAALPSNSSSGTYWGATHPIGRLHTPLVHRLHNTALFVGNISHPIRLPCCYKQMRAPPLYMPI